jgi:hypothetical protein
MKTERIPHRCAVCAEAHPWRFDVDWKGRTYAERRPCRCERTRGGRRPVRELVPRVAAPAGFIIDRVARQGVVRAKRPKPATVKTLGRMDKQRRQAGVCQTCELPVDGAVGLAYYCADCRPVADEMRAERRRAADRERSRQRRAA